MKSVKESVVPVEIIQNKIYLIRGRKVMFDRDLSKLYCIETRRLNEQVKRNMKRFPEDFCFQLTNKETQDWMSQIAISSKEKMGIRKMPYVFTEQGVAMLSSVLNSDRAIEVNIQIMRIFTKMREIMVTHKELAAKLSEVENTVNKHDKEIQRVFEAIRRLMSTPVENNDIYKRTKIGFVVEK